MFNQKTENKNKIIRGYVKKFRAIIKLKNRSKPYKHEWYSRYGEHENVLNIPNSKYTNSDMSVCVIDDINI